MLFREFLENEAFKLVPITALDGSIPGIGVLTILQCAQICLESTDVSLARCPSKPPLIMIELKVQCDCGQKYKFDVEPVNGQMPFTVACPVCGVDGTEKANGLLQQLPPEPATQPSKPVALQARLRISSSAPQTTSPPPPPPLAPVTAVAPPPPIGAMRPAPAPAAAAKKDRGKPSFGLGLLGGALGTLVGTLLYYLIFHFLGFRLKLLAVGVGALAGWGAEYLGRGEGSKELGGLTAIFVLAGIIGAQYLVALSWWHKAVPSSMFNSAYTNSVIEARAVIKAVPTGSDEEIRNYLAQEQAGEDGEVGAKPNPASITKEDIKEFREKDLPQFQDLASGKITHEQYNAIHGVNTIREQSQDSEEGTFKAVFLLLLLSRSNLVSLCLAAGLAFKMSTNA